MKKQLILMVWLIISGITGFAQSTTLTAKLVNRKYGFGYPSLTEKDQNGYPLIKALTIPAIYDETTNVTFVEEYENLAGVKKDGKWGYIDATGATKIPFKFDEAGYFHEGLAPVTVGGKCGFINKNGTLVIPYKYEYATSFTDGLAYVELGGKIGFINKSGTAVVAIKYDKQTTEAQKRCYHCGGVINTFNDGKAVVALNGKCGVVDAKGNFTECKDEELETITYTGSAKKDNPSAWLKGTCATNQDIRTISINDKERNDIITNYDNRTMFCYLSNIKKGDRFTIKLVHAKGCKYTLQQPNGLTFDPGQANVSGSDDRPEAPSVDAKGGLDSTTFSGIVVGNMAIIQSDIAANDIKRVLLNDVDVLAKLPGGQRRIINFPTFKLKTGQRVTIKVIQAKGSSVKMLDPKGVK